jgi:hypothetical protein
MCLHQLLNTLLSDTQTALAQLAPDAGPAVSTAHLGMHRVNVRQ